MEDCCILHILIFVSIQSIFMMSLNWHCDNFSFQCSLSSIYTDVTALQCVHIMEEQILAVRWPHWAGIWTVFHFHDYFSVTCQNSSLILYFRLSTFYDLYWVCLSVFSCTVLFVSISQVIGCDDCLRNDRYCVEWGRALNSTPTNQSLWS